jgi:RNA polymerase sigma factor (sigma-70 family)
MASAAEPSAEAQLFERHSDSVFRYCLHMLGSREEAEDAAQTTFFQAVRAMRRGVHPTYEQAWLLAIAKNECRSRHRANGRRRRLELVHDPQTLEEVAEAPEGNDGTLIGVQRALERLPEAQRRAVLLREWQGCSYAEIAEELGTSVPSVEALLFRARRTLARELGADTKTRSRALDVASLLAGLKSALGGGAAVKVAAVVVAAATVGAVAGGAEEGSLRRPDAQAPAPVSADAPPAHIEAATVGAARDGRRVTRPVPGARMKRAPVAEHTTAERRSQTPVEAAQPAPATEKAAEGTAPPQAPPAGKAPAPVSPPIAIPAPPTPQAPSLPEVPKVETPQLPQVPKVETPQLPQVPQLPQPPPLPDAQVPDLPDLAPVVPDLPPDLPDLP